ncbi:hypothetical protein NQZ68_020917 [Dissostichus eleginoides]|nr:hypothetical protein NQZ68_020917 [Dissostichus eleginoides]
MLRLMEASASVSSRGMENSGRYVDCGSRQRWIRGLRVDKQSEFNGRQKTITRPPPVTLSWVQRLATQVSATVMYQQNSSKWISSQQQQCSRSTLSLSVIQPAFTLNNLVRLQPGGLGVRQRGSHGRRGYVNAAGIGARKDAQSDLLNCPDYHQSSAHINRIPRELLVKSMKEHQ